MVEGRSATYTTEKMILEVELSGTWALSFDDFEDLRRKASVNTGVHSCLSTKGCTFTASATTYFVCQFDLAGN